MTTTPPLLFSSPDCLQHLKVSDELPDNRQERSSQVRSPENPNPPATRRQAGETLGTYLEPYEAALIRARAAAAGRTVAAEIRLAVRAHLENDRSGETP
jgi:hypothetical protein